MELCKELHWKQKNDFRNVGLLISVLTLNSPGWIFFTMFYHLVAFSIMLYNKDTQNQCNKNNKHLFLASSCILATVTLSTLCTGCTINSLLDYLCVILKAELQSTATCIIFMEMAEVPGNNVSHINVANLNNYHAHEHSILA